MCKVIPVTDAGIMLNMVYQAMKKLELDCATIFAQVAMPDVLPNPNMRYRNSSQQRFWRVAAEVSANNDIGLHIGDNMSVFRGQVLEYLYLSSPTFGDGLKRSLKYSRLLTDSLQIGLRVDGDVAILYGFNHPVRHFLEVIIVGFLRFFSYVTEGDFQATEIWLPYTNGANAEDYQRVFGCPARLAMSSDGAIRFDARLLQRPSSGAEPRLLKSHEALALERMVELNRGDLVFCINELLGDLLERRSADLETIASQLKKTPRAVRADLALIGTNLNQVISNYRENLARKLLSKTSESIDQIVYLTGFSEPSAFNRAFKRWTNESPLEYRKRQQNHPTSAFG